MPITEIVLKISVALCHLNLSLFLVAKIIGFCTVYLFHYRKTEINEIVLKI